MVQRKRSRDSIKFAAEGILHCFRSQRHMQIHFSMLVLVLVSGLMLALDTTQMLLLLFCISLVIATEMVNTAVETVVDMVTRTYHPLAKLSKDVAAGAVLVASANAVVAGTLILFGSGPIRRIGKGGLFPAERSPDVTVVVVVGLMVLTVGVIISKLLQGRSNAGVMQGGAVSGHSAIGFFLAMTIVFTSDNRFVSLLAFLMAIDRRARPTGALDRALHSRRQSGGGVDVFLSVRSGWSEQLAAWRCSTAT